MFCSQCKWYCQATDGVNEGLAENDRCHHDQSGHLVGGVREESRLIFYTCEAMLDGICSKHKLFEPKLAVA